MADRNWRLLVVALLTALIPLVARAQSLPPQPQPVPSNPVVIGPPQPAQPYAPPLSPLPDIGVGVGIGVNPPPPCGAPFVPGTPGMPAPGAVDGCCYFAGLQLDVLKPVFSDHLQGTFTGNDGTTITVQPPSHPIAATLSPKIEFGWHLPECDCGGDIILSYRFIASQGTGSSSDPAGDFNVRSRLDFNIFDVDYISKKDEFAPHWNVVWCLGARVVAAYYDTQGTNATLSDQASNNFVGAGPKGGLEVQRQFAVLPAFSLFARADGSAMVGKITQKYYETFENNPNSPLSGSVLYKATQTVPTFSLSAGLNYVPPAAEYLRFSIGYQWERWWSLGRADGAGLDLTTQSFYLRGEFEF